jgi:hypothetical protein
MIEAGSVNMNSYYNPYRVLLEIYDARGEHGKSLELLRKLQSLYPNDPGLKARIEMVETMARVTRSVDTLAATDTAAGASR